MGGVVTTHKALDAMLNHFWDKYVEETKDDPQKWVKPFDHNGASVRCCFTVNWDAPADAPNFIIVTHDEFRLHGIFGRAKNMKGTIHPIEIHWNIRVESETALDEWLLEYSPYFM